MRVHNLTNLLIFHTFILLWWSFILFSQPIILRKVCVLEIFLAQSFRQSHYFFKEDLSFEEIVSYNPSMYNSLFFPFPSLTFPPFFPFHLSYNQTWYYFPNSANKKKCFEDINKKSLNFVRMWCKIHILHHPIRDVTSIFYLKLNTSYHN